MNSYPLELLAQLAPVMFVAGLNPPPPPAPAPVAPSSGPTPPAPTHHSRHPSFTGNSDSNLPTSQSHSNLTSNAQPTPPATRPDPFTILLARLREILLNQRKVTVWDPPTFTLPAQDKEEKEVIEKKKIFQVVLVDKDSRFPPRKVTLETPSQGEIAGPNVGHSPLSPLTPTSPLHPDGLIAPIWIRKHTMLVPAVFVLFTRLFELDSTNTPPSPPDALELERQQDTILATSIAQRKRSTNERGIKLTVVLLASRRMLDDPSLNLDARLTFIRRQSGLDSRAALFVLSPIPREELSEFVKSLQAALWDPAVEYYTAHSKRVRQKRNRHQAQSSQQSSQYNPSSNLGPINGAAALSPKGWTVRYEYKMACFAEFRGEHEVALKHYQDAYTALTMLFLAPGSSLAVGAAAASISAAAVSSGERGSISTTTTPHLASHFPLPPRTKRWAEAKVLADTINIKIIKLYLYNNETALALAQQRLHVRTFPTVAGFVGLATGASLGAGEGKEVRDAEEGSYEYWSWVGRMWSVLAEMLVEGSRTPGTNLIIPVHRPRLPPSGPSASTTVATVGRKSALAEGYLSTGTSLGLNPSHALMHPGWYYLLAAECGERKVARFIQGSKVRGGEMSEEQRKTYLGNVRGLVGDVLELYTKSYELFKAYGSQSPSSAAVVTSPSNPSTIATSSSNPPTTPSIASQAFNPPINSSAGSGAGTGRLPLYIAHRIALTYALFPDPNPSPRPVPPADGKDAELDLLVWDSSQDEEVKEFQGKDPEKLALAARFLARIAKSYQREGVSASSTVSPTTFPSFPISSRIGRAVSASSSDPESDTNDSLQLGWPTLLVPLLRTWSGILKFLIGNELRLVRSLSAADEKLKADALVKLEEHVESYIRVLVERISVDSGSAKTEKERSQLQRELNRAMRTWNFIQHQKVADGKAEVDEGDEKVIRIDHTDTQPIFDTSVVFWRGRVWVSSSAMSDTSEAGTSLKVEESTPFQLSITSPSGVAIDELVWSEVRIGVVFEYESFENDVSSLSPTSETGGSEEGAGRGAQEEESRAKIRKKEVVIVLRPVQHGSATGPQDEANDLVSTIDLGHIDFDPGSDSAAENNAVIERAVNVSLKWNLGRTKVLTGTVGVRGSSGVGEGRIRLSSLLFRLVSPTLSTSSSASVLELPLNIPARRGAPPPPPSVPDSLQLVNPSTSNGVKAQSQVQALWFAGFIESESAKKPRWVPVSRRRDDEGGAYEYVEVKHRPHPLSISVHHSGPAYVGEEYPVEVVVSGCSCCSAHQEGREETVEVVMDVLLQPVETDITAVNTISMDTYQSNAMIRGIPLGLLALHPHSSSSAPAQITRTLWIKNTGGAGDRVFDMGVRTRPVFGENRIANPRLETETLKTVSIPCIEPLSVSYDVTYRRRPPPAPSGGPAKSDGKSWWLIESAELSKDEDNASTWVERVEADTEVIVRTTFGCIAPSGVKVEKVVLKNKGDNEAVKILSSEIGLEEEGDIGIFPFEFLPGDGYCDVCRIGIANRDEDENLDGGEIHGPGEYEVFWRRILPLNERQSLSTTLFSLPTLHPPSDELIALLDVPPVAKLHEPIPLTLTIRNRHPTRTADVYVQLEASSTSHAVTMGDPSSASTSGTVTGAAGPSTQGQISDSTMSQGFVVAGLRAGRVPLLLAGAEERLTWMLIPIECGHMNLPTIRVIDRRKSSRETVGLVAGAESEDGDTIERDRNYTDADGRGGEVKVIDIRTEGRRGEAIQRDEQGGVDSVMEKSRRIGTVLVLP
ncbi:hypothetical protein GYMLUDRAFT_69742 [Collybiopsis luxurians FD-317 M1]|nr:hypothetical protein GYMLUDRAFT_69742 [Collybiopsis luxurians FD-317 M1]